MRRRLSASEVKYNGLTVGMLLIRDSLSMTEASRIPGVAVKRVDIRRNTSGEGGSLGHN